MIKYGFIISVIALIASSAMGTTQDPDLLILEGKLIYSYDLPFLHEAFPEIHFSRFKMISTANRKGYRATWATFQKQLYLIGLEARVAGEEKTLTNNEILPEATFPLKVTAWSGIVVNKVDHSSLSLNDLLEKGDEAEWTEEIKVTTITIENGMVEGIEVSIEKENIQE